MTPYIDSPRSQLTWNKSNVPQDVSAKLIIVMVGLPARGKSYIVKKLARYLNWLQFPTRIFNAGQRRRSAATSKDGQPSDVSSAAFFDPSNPDGVALRDKIALDTLDELLAWLRSDNEATVGIFDATNTTVERRRLVVSHIRTCSSQPPDILFLESYTFDKSILQSNMRLKLFGPDYHNQQQGPAMADFIRRVAHYTRTYVPLGAFEEQQSLPYVSMVDVGRKIGTHMIHGFLSTQVVEYLLNFNLTERQIWLTCNGESIDDRVGKIGRNADLTNHGRAYAAALRHFIGSKCREWERSRRKESCDMHPEELNAIAFARQLNNQQTNDNHSCNEDAALASSLSTITCTCTPKSNPLQIWTSTMPQSIQTAAPFLPTASTQKHMKMLDDLNAGDMTGLTFPEIESLHPSVFSARRRDRLLYRWPRTRRRSVH